MSDKTKISFAHHTGSPWIGCTPISPGCKNCYASELDRCRFSKTMGGTKDKPKLHFGRGAPRWKCKGFEANARKWDRQADVAVSGRGFMICPDCGADLRTKFQKGSGIPLVVSTCACGSKTPPKRIRKPRVFPSLCDWLDAEVPIEWLADFLNILRETQNLTWMLFTKRSENWRLRLGAVLVSEANKPDKEQNVPLGKMLFDWLNGTPPPNLWIYASVEDQEQADKRIPELLKIPAMVHGISAEPLLNKIDFRPWLATKQVPLHTGASGNIIYGRTAPKIEHIICGGESGSKRRYCGVEAITNIIDQCKAAGIPPYCKQDCALKPGQQGRIPTEHWRIKDFPKV